MARNDRFSGDSGSLTMAGSSWEGAKREVAMVAEVVVEAVEGAAEREGVIPVCSASVFCSHLISTDEAAGNVFEEVKPSHFLSNGYRDTRPHPRDSSLLAGVAAWKRHPYISLIKKLRRPDITYYIITDVEAACHRKSQLSRFWWPGKNEASVLRCFSEHT
jgi:hypothetical protein